MNDDGGEKLDETQTAEALGASRVVPLPSAGADCTPLGLDRLAREAGEIAGEGGGPCRTD